MKRKLFCRISSFALAVILAAESGMTVNAAQVNGYPEAAVVTENETAAGAETQESKDNGNIPVTEEGSTAENVSLPEESSEPETVTVPEESSEAETVTKPEESSEPETVTEPEESSEPETVTVPEESSEPETVTEPEESSEPETVTEPEGSSETETVTETEEDSETETETETEEATVEQEEVVLDGQGQEAGICWSNAADKEVTLVLNEEGKQEKQFSVAYEGPDGTPGESVDTTVKTITWFSSNRAVAMVDNTGKVKAIGKGKTVITASVDGKKVTSTVTVEVAVETVFLSRSKMTLRMGNETTEVIGVLTANIMPANAEIPTEVVWASSAPAVAEVKGSGLNASVTAKSPGTAVITVKAAGKSASCEVAVKVPVNKIALQCGGKDITELEIQKSDDEHTYQKEITVSVSPENATLKDIRVEAADEGLVTWKTEQNKIVLTSTQKLGKTNMTVTVDEQSVTIPISVVEEEVQIEETSDVIPVQQVSFVGMDEMTRTVKLEVGGESELVEVTVNPADATNQEIEWISSDTKVAMVSAIDGSGSKKAEITATGVGRAQITAKTENGAKATLLVVVTTDVEEVMINEAVRTRTLYCNGDNEVFEERPGVKKEHQLELTQPDLECTWRSSNEAVASVDEKGKVTAKKAGTAQIVAVNQASGKSDSITVVVEELVEKIELPVYETKIVLGTEMKLSAVVLPKEATDKEYEWQVPTGYNSPLSYNEKKNTITAENVTTGAVTITAKAKDSGQVKAEMKITVVDNVNAASKIALLYNGKKASGATVKSGTDFTLEPRITDTSQADAIDKVIAYTSSNEKVATVDENGKVTAVAAGKSVITATVMDGSNKAAKFTVTVEQRPEAITFARDTYLIAPTKAVTLAPIFTPSNTNGKYKKVNWEVIYGETAEGNMLDSETLKKYVVVDANGKVTVKKDAPEGLKAYISCTSKAYGENELPVANVVTIEVGKTPVSSLKMKKTAVELTGLGATATLEYTLKGASETTSYVWTSSNEKVITVDQNGEITAVGYGTAKVTLCVDNALTVSCNIASYPVKKGQGIAAVSKNYGIQQAENDGNAFVQLMFINSKTKAAFRKEELSELFTFTSSKPEIVYVDENGVAYANPETEIKKDIAVTITATLKDDPLKRKATTKVTVWKNEQAKSLEFQYLGNGETKYKPITDLVEEEFTQGSTFKLKVYAYNAKNELMDADGLIGFKLSDTSLAQIIKREKKSNIITVKVKKPGKFKITCTANDKLHVSREVTFGMYSGKPIMETTALGTVNKSGDIVYVDEAKKNGIYSDTAFTLKGANGSDILGNVQIKSVRLKSGSSYRNAGFAESDLRIVRQEDGAFRLAMDSEVLAKKTTKNGTYEIQFTVRRSAMKTGTSFGGGEQDEALKATFKIADTKPSVKISNVTINSFERGTWAKLKINTKAEIENITFSDGQELSRYFDLEERQDGWYIAIKDEKFDSCKTKTSRGNFYVQVKGYEKPISVSVAVSAKMTKPSLKQLAVPDIMMAKGDTASITLYDNRAKANLTDYTVSLKAKQKEKWTITDGNAGKNFTVQLTNAGKNVTKVTSHTHVVLVKKESWREAVEMKITAKASPVARNVNPSISFTKATFTLNTVGNEETYTTPVKVNKSNVTLKEGDWNPYLYFKNNKRPEWADWFTASYADGSLIVGIKEEAAEMLKKAKATQYKLQFVDVIDGEGYESVKTGTITININKKTPAAVIKLAGSMDLLNRKASNLTGTVSIQNLSAEIADITLIDGWSTNATKEFTDKFYCVQKGNKFTVYARNAAALTTTKQTGAIQVTLKNGTVLKKEFSFTPKQSTPKLKAVAAQTIYKAEADNTADYNLNASMPKGIAINKLETRVCPAGLGVEYKNGHAHVVLNDNFIKPGTYTIQTDVYFKGAQRISGSDAGKPVRIKFKVVVKEQ